MSDVTPGTITPGPEPDLCAPPIGDFDTDDMATDRPVELYTLDEITTFMLPTWVWS